MIINVDRLFSRYILDCDLNTKIFNNGVKNVNVCTKDEYPEDFVMCLFDWDDTREGRDYWLSVHRGWIEYLKESGVGVPENYG